jgi:hypothetical protein
MGCALRQLFQSSTCFSGYNLSSELWNRYAATRANYVRRRHRGGPLADGVLARMLEELTIVNEMKDHLRFGIDRKRRLSRYKGE